MRNACLNARSSKASPLLFKAVLRAVGIAYKEFTSNTLTLTLTRPARRPARSKTARARSELVEAQGAEQRGHQPVRRRDRPLRARRRVPARAGHY